MNYDHKIKEAFDRLQGSINSSLLPSITDLCRYTYSNLNDNLTANITYLRLFVTKTILKRHLEDIRNSIRAMIPMRPEERAKVPKDNLGVLPHLHYILTDYLSIIPNVDLELYKNLSKYAIGYETATYPLLMASGNFKDRLRIVNDFLCGLYRDKEDTAAALSHLVADLKFRDNRANELMADTTLSINAYVKKNYPQLSEEGQ